MPLMAGFCEFLYNSFTNRVMGTNVKCTRQLSHKSAYKERCRHPYIRDRHIVGDKIFYEEFSDAPSLLFGES